MEVFNDIIVFPKGVSFPALVKLLEDKKFVNFLIWISVGKIFFRILLIDVRNASELINPGKIPGSVHLPLYQISEAFQMSGELFKEKYNFEKPQPGDRNVVLTCRWYWYFIWVSRLHLTSLPRYQVWAENTGGWLPPAGPRLQWPSSLLWKLQRLEKQRRKNSLDLITFYSVHFIFVYNQ